MNFDCDSLSLLVQLHPVPNAVPIWCWTNAIMSSSRHYHIPDLELAMSAYDYEEIVTLVSKTKENQSMPLADAIRLVANMPNVRDRMMVVILRDGQPPIHRWDEIRAIYNLPDFPAAQS